MILLSFTGTLRLVLILLILWILLRMFIRAQEGSPTKGRGSNWARPDQRPKGDVRIEKAGDERASRDRGPVEDADFEEIR